MRIGDLNKIIDIQSKTRVADGIGGFTETWATQCSGIYAAIWPVSAKEQIQSDQMSMIITHRIRIRYRSRIKSDWRIKYANRYFSIMSIINPNEANGNLELLCKEVRV